MSFYTISLVSTARSIICIVFRDSGRSLSVLALSSLLLRIAAVSSSGWPSSVPSSLSGGREKRLLTITECRARFAVLLLGRGSLSERRRTSTGWSHMHGTLQSLYNALRIGTDSP